jgi:hypothetical protein
MIINEDIIEGNPSELMMSLQTQIANQILHMSTNDYEDVCANMRMTSEIFEILEEHINNEIVTLKYNPMGAWYYVESEER